MPWYLKIEIGIQCRLVDDKVEGIKNGKKYKINLFIFFLVGHFVIVFLSMEFKKKKKRGQQTV